MGSWQWKTSIFQSPCFSQCLTTLLMYCLSICRHFWVTNWFTKWIWQQWYLKYWGVYCVQSSFLAMPSLLYHPRRFVLAERFNTRWVFLTLEMNASWNLWVWDGNSKPKWKQVKTVWSLFSPTCIKMSTRPSLSASRFFQRSWISWGTWMAPDGLRSHRRLNLPSTAA